jgi:hypothetical protein
VKLGTLSPGLRHLLESKLDTIEKIDLAVLLRAAASALPLREVATQLQVGRDVMRRVAEEAAAAGIVAIFDDDRIELLATDDELAGIDALGQLCANDRPRMSELLTSVAIERRRTMAARSFADAFKLGSKRTKKGDGDG